MAATTTSSALTPALISKMSPGGRGARGALNYDAQKDGARLLWTNLEGTTPRQWACGMKAFLCLNPRCRRGVDHVSLSLDPRLGTITDEEFVVAVKAWLSSMGYGDRAAVCHLHTDEPQLHVHLVICRIDAAGKVHADGGNWKRSHAAAVHAAEAIGLKPLPPRPDANRLPAPTDRQISANKRAVRRGTKVQNHASVSRIFDYVVSKSVNLEEVEAAATEAGLEVQIKRKSGGSIQGLNVRTAGAEEWLKASELKADRSLSWLKVEVRLARNLELRDLARAKAEQFAAAARDRAEHRVAARLDKQSKSVSQPARAFALEATHAAKEAITMDNTLDFLNPPPLPHPPGVPLDDASLVPSSVTDDGFARHKKKQKTEQEDREQAVFELESQIRRLSVKELLDLRSTVSPLVMSLASIEALVNLIIRLFTLGIVKRVNTLGDALAARAELGECAEKELARRRRSPATHGERKAALSAYAAAVEERSRALVARDTFRSMPDPRAHEHRERRAIALRQRIEDAFDQKRAAASLETIKTRRSAHDDARAKHRRVRAENDMVPAGFGLLITKAQRDAAAAAKSAAALTLMRAAELRKAAKHQLQLLLDEVEAAAIEHEQQAAEQAAAVEKTEAIERDALARELRSLPVQILEFGVAAERERIGQRAAELMADASRPKTPAEAMAEEDLLQTRRGLAECG